MPMNGDMQAGRSQLRPIPKEDFDIQGALKSFNKDDLAQVSTPQNSDGSALACWAFLSVFNLFPSICIAVA